MQQSPGWQPTLCHCVAWCLIWWFARLGKSMVIHDTECPVLRPGVIKQHKTKPNPMYIPFIPIAFLCMGQLTIAGAPILYNALNFQCAYIWCEAHPHSLLTLPTYRKSLIFHVGLFRKFSVNIFRAQTFWQYVITVLNVTISWTALSVTRIPGRGLLHQRWKDDV